MLDQTENDSSLNVLAVQVDQQVDQCLVVAVADDAAADAAIGFVCVMGMGITLSQGKGFLVFVCIFVFSVWLLLYTFAQCLSCFLFFLFLSSAMAPAPFSLFISFLCVLFHDSSFFFVV